MSRKVLRHLYIVPLIVTTIIIIADCNLKLITPLVKEAGLFATLIPVSCTFIGFVLTSVTIFWSMPRDTKYMKQFKNSGHDKIFRIICTLAIVFFIIPVAWWLFGIPFVQIAIYSFISGILETVAMFYYIIHMSLDNS